MDEPFAIDLHLEAHGGIDLMEWYCGDLSCGTGSERVFNNREDFDSHIATEHQGSSYRLAALRRVPKREVLVACLAKWLRFEYTATQVASISISRKEFRVTDGDQMKAFLDPFIAAAAGPGANSAGGASPNRNNRRRCRSEPGGRCRRSGR